MMKAPKKIYIAITGLLMAAATQANAAGCNPSPCKPEYCQPECVSECECDTNDNEFNIYGELLYWTPSLRGLQSAFGNTSIATVANTPTFTTTTITESDVKPHSKWSPGWRVGADFVFGCCLDLAADWTHFDGHASHKSGGQHGRWNIKYDVIDLTLGSFWYTSPCFYFKPFIGVRGAIIHQTLTSHLETLVTSSAGSNITLTDMNDKENFWGVGPELGIEANWCIGWNLSLYAMFDVVTYYGNVKATNHDTDTFTRTANVTNATSKDWFNNIGTDGAVGIRWDTIWYQCGYDITCMLKLGLEQHRIYDFSNLGSDGTLSLDGGVFAAGVGVRF